jgi:CMP-2-keto-3-deoxyoctulosonic acid synthetase
MAGSPAAPLRPLIVIPARAVEADLGPVVVACGEAEIAAAIRAAGGEALVTEGDHASGSDRIFEAVERLDPDEVHDAIVNIQGDLPTIEPESVRAALRPLGEPGVDIGTLVAEIADPRERRDPNITKAALVIDEATRCGRAFYFSRSPVPWPGEDDSLPLYHHIGLYAYRRAALQRFVGSSSCARWRPACASTRRSLTRFRSVSILPPTSSAPARPWRRRPWRNDYPIGPAADFRRPWAKPQTTAVTRAAIPAM